MAIFASANSTGYGDPIKALSIKALEQRQKDMLAQQSQQQFDAASMATIPGGIGHVLGIVGDNMRQGQTDAALASNRAALAQAMTGYDANKGMTPEQRGVLSRVAPEILDKLLTHEQETRQLATTEGGLNQRNAATIAGQSANVAAQEAGAGARTHEQVTGHSADVSTQEAGAGTRQQQKLEADKAAAAELAKTQEAQAAANEARVQARPSEDPAAQVVRAEKDGELPHDIAQQRLDQLLAKKPGDVAKIEEMQKGAVDTQSGLKELNEAAAIMNSPEGIHTGQMGRLKTGLGGIFPESLGGPNDATQANTKRFNQILSGQGMQALLKMKGASSDKDVQISFEIINDPNQNLASKRKALETLVTKLTAYAEIEKQSLGKVGAPVPTITGGPTAVDPAKVSTAADPAQKAAADPARAAATDPAAAPKTVEGITEAQAKQLPPNTRFKLIDGRTGRTAP